MTQNSYYPILFNEKDNVAVLNEYAKENGCFGKWHLLIGDKEADLFNS
jgi:hypothetical protein